MIDEKKLLEEIRKCVMSRITPDGSSPYDRDIQFYNDAIVDVLEIIEEQPKIDRWITVEEMLPPYEIEYVLYNNKNDDIGICMVEWFIENSDDMVAWQPLPPKYKVEDEM